MHLAFFSEAHRISKHQWKKPDGITHQFSYPQVGAQGRDVKKNELMRNDVP